MSNHSQYKPSVFDTVGCTYTGYTQTPVPEMTYS